MKLKSKSFLKSREGEEKIKRVFLWLPTRFGDEPTLRWLEMANVVYSIKKIDFGDGYCSDYHWVWTKDRFATDEDFRCLPFEGIDSSDVYDVLLASFGNVNKFSFSFDILVILFFLINLELGITALLTLNIVKLAFTWADSILKD